MGSKLLGIPEPEPLVYSIDETATALRIGRSNVKRLVADGSLAATKIGRRILIRRESLLALLDRGA